MSVLLSEARNLTNRLGQIVSAVQDIVDAVDEPTSTEQETNGAAATPTDKRGGA